MRLDIGLEVEEVCTLRGLPPLLRGNGADHQTADDGVLPRQARIPRLRQEAQAALEDPHPLLLTRQVLAGRPEQAGPEPGAHDRKLGGDGVGQRQGRLPRGHQGLELGADEAVGDDLLVAAGHQGLAGAVEVEGRLRRGPGGGPGRGMGHGDVVVAVDAADLAMRSTSRTVSKRLLGGRTSQPSAIGETSMPSAVRMSATSASARLQPEDLGDPGATQDAGRLAPGQIRRALGLHHGAGLAADDVEQQPGGALEGADLEPGIDPALEAVGRIGMQPVAAGLAAGDGGGEEGALQEDVAGAPRPPRTRRRP